MKWLGLEIASKLAINMKLSTITKNRNMPGIGVSIVCYNSDIVLLLQVIEKLFEATEFARKQGSVGVLELYLVNNGPHYWVRELEDLLKKVKFPNCFILAAVISGHGNVGYGRGHNLAFARASQKYHLVLNPDVLLGREAFAEAISFMNHHPDVGLLAPAVTDGRGRPLYLCKRYPSVFNLGLRAFAPDSVKRLFQRRLDHYEMRDCLGEQVLFDVPLVSGCFMWFRRSVFSRLGGFCGDYFLYFEDYDLSLRAARFARTAYVPRVRIVHFGGNAARKGFRHMVLFLRSAVTFFNHHGWRWL